MHLARSHWRSRAVIDQRGSGQSGSGAGGRVNANSARRGLRVGKDRPGNAVAIVEGDRCLVVRIVRVGICIGAVGYGTLTLVVIEVCVWLTAVVNPNRAYAPTVGEALGEAPTSRSLDVVGNARAGDIWEIDAAGTPFPEVWVERVLREAGSVAAAQRPEDFT